MQEVAGWPVAFRGSAAVRAGLVTWDRLRGPRFRRLFPDVYVPASAEPPGLLVRSLAAYRLVEGRGVLSGYSAAALLGADCAPSPDVPAEVSVAGRPRTPDGLVVRHVRLPPDEVTQLGGVRLTTALRTAYDLARGADLVEAVVAVDALANRCRFSPDLVLHLSARHLGSRGSRQVPEVLARVDRRAGSPMETRLRLVLTEAGLPRPEVQWVVQDERARTAIWIDLAYPELRIAIEYEGAGHTDPKQVLRDAGRYTRLVDRGWTVLRYTAREIYREPHRVVAEVTRARERARSTTSG